MWHILWAAITATIEVLLNFIDLKHIHKRSSSKQCCSLSQHYWINQNVSNLAKFILVLNIKDNLKHYLVSRNDFKFSHLTQFNTMKEVFKP